MYETNGFLELSHYTQFFRIQINCFESHMHRNIKVNISRSDYAVSI